MKRIRITLVEEIEVPDHVSIETNEHGVTTGLRLKDGRLIRPWVGYEIEPVDGGYNETIHYYDLIQLDIVTGELVGKSITEI